MHVLRELFETFLRLESLVVVPVLWIIGTFLKRTPKVPNWCIPWLLLALALACTLVLFGFSFMAIEQGVVATGIAVLGHELLKETAKKKKP